MMERFVKSIKYKYIERHLVREEQWPPVSGDKLINLQLVEADKKEGFRGGLPQYGAGNETGKRAAILRDDLFRVEEGNKSVRMVLVEGNGGMGKTTLCTMLSEEWAEGKTMTQFYCVLLLPLREQSVAKAESLPDLFKLFHSSERVRTSVVNELEENEGEKMLIIADGWDELEEASRSENSFLYKLLFGHILPFACVLLTSRPSASAPLHSLPSVDRLVEVVGFNEENINDYIESEFATCPEKASGLVEQLDNNPLIQNVCSVPLNCAITCNLWRTLDQELPSTLTELYTQIILNVILRDIKKKYPDFLISLSLISFDSIPPQLKQYWWSTCKFAFEAISYNQLIFTEDEVAVFFPYGFVSSQAFLCFGLLQSAHSILPLGHGLSFHFLHISFQEYLAALHLVSLPTVDQLEVIRTFAGNSRFDVVWRFYFGLGSNVDFAQVSKNIVCFDEEVVDMFLSLSVDRESKLLLCHCALESRNNSFSCKVAEHIDGQFCHGSDSIAHTPHDYEAIIHVLSHTSRCYDMRISLKECGLNDKLLKILTDLLSSTDGERMVIELNLGSNKLTSKGISDLLHKASSAFCLLEKLVLESNNIDGDGVNSIITSLMHISCKHLAVLSLSNNPCGVSGIEALERAVTEGGFVNLEWLGLSNSLTGDANRNGALLATFLKSITCHCPRLVGLSLSGNHLGVPGACALGEFLPLLSNKKDIHLGMNNTMLDNEAIIAFTGCIKNSSPMPSKPSTEPKEHWSQLDSSYSAKLGTLDLCSNKIGDEGVTALLALVQHLSPSFSHVLLHGNPVSDGMQEKLDECLQINREVSCYMLNN